ncbi:MAG: hypothetical protein A2Y38_21850 [Spirochaetes bacterium GWB1_59_5]|nr:MAG: hypothetical protein A2Y38_21850 [Spirochaetes bacterium GWB1_59_5]
MKKSGLRITTRMSLGFAILLLCIVALGSIALEQSDQIARRTQALYEHPLTVRRALGELKADILIMQRDMKDLLLVEEEADIASILQSIEDSRRDALRQFEVLYDRYLGDQAQLGRAADDFARWDAIRQETIRLIGVGKRQEALVRTRTAGTGGDHVRLLLEHLQMVDSFAMNKGDEFYQESVALKNALKLQMSLLIAGTLALSGIIVFLLYRSVRKPLSELIAATRDFMKGNRTARCAYDSNDEFGQFSASFNELAGAIQNELDLGSRAAALAAVMLGSDDARLFCHRLLATLLEHTGSQLGAVYLLNEEKTLFEAFESIGMDTARCGAFSALRFEGEFGPALATGKIQHIVDIPADTRSILKTADGFIAPRSIVTIPVSVGGVPQAVISLASVGGFSAASLRLLDTVLGILCARMDGILTYRKLEEFSRKLGEQNRELESQKSEMSSQTRELTEQNIELEMQKRQLDEANKLKSSFLSTMSHELRTPLNSVIALSGVLSRRLKDIVSAEEYSYLDVIERNGKHLLELINDILDLSRIESGREELEIERFDARVMIREVVELIGPQAIEKGIFLQFEEDESLPEMLSDYDKCRHILQNLVANAVKFTEAGGVKVSALTKAESLYISVEDTGIGIEEKNLSLIFEEFRQADDSASRKYGGTGLGLAIAKNYADILGGSISVQSQSGRGSLFTVRLPLLSENGRLREGQAPGFRIDMNAQSAPVAGPLATKGKTILLVEDSEPIIIQMKDMLSAQGYTIVVARDGGEALEIIERQLPDGMILDLMMPRVDGFQVLKAIREEKKSERLPVVILTAKYVTKEDLAFLRHNCVHQLIQKGDINKPRLLEAVARMLFPEPDRAMGTVPEYRPRKAAPAPEGTLPLVLLVEDNADNLLTLRALLSGLYRLAEAADGAAGIDLARRLRPDLILMDSTMPGLSGAETLAALRQDVSLSGIPVIVITARAMKGDRELFLAEGFDGYVSKPVDRDALLKAMADCTGDR